MSEEFKVENPPSDELKAISYNAEMLYFDKCEAISVNICTAKILFGVRSIADENVYENYKILTLPLFALIDLRDRIDNILAHPSIKETLNDQIANLSQAVK